MPVTNYQPPCQRRLCALLCLAALAALPAALHAAEPAAAPATQAGARSIDIGPGPLSEVLARYAASAGVALSFDAASLRQIPSPGLKGHYTVQQGFDRLLAGSGMEAVQTSAGNFALRRLPPVIQGEATLKPMLVTASAERDGTTEGTGSYTTRASSTATKLNLSLRETPQTVTVVTRQKMDDFGLTSVDNVLESTSSIAIMRKGNNGADYYSRGFLLQSQYDGMPNPVGIGESNRGPVPDTAFFDRVEILQGASGLMSGAGDPGGTINLVHKRPTEQFQAHAEAQLGSWNKKRLTGDVSGPLDAVGKLRGRIVVLVDNSDSFTDRVFDDRQGVYGIVEADVTATTVVAASVMYQKSEFNNHYGVPMGANGADLGLPRTRFFGVGSGNRTRDSSSYSLNVEQKLPADWLMKAAYTHTQFSVDKVAHFLTGTLNPVTGNGLSVSGQCSGLILVDTSIGDESKEDSASDDPYS